MSDSYKINMPMFCFMKEDVLAPPPENDDVVNDFDIEEEVIEVENRSDSVYICGYVTHIYLCVRTYT